METQMQNDDETTAYQLHKLLMEKGYSMSLSTMLHCRVQLELYSNMLETILKAPF